MYSLDLQRTEMLYGNEAVEKLRASNICIFGIGGVGSFVCEAIARAGAGKMTIIDKDTVDRTNLNRQLIALQSTIGQYKTDVMEKRIHDINPDCTVTKHTMLFNAETVELIDFSEFTYVIDAIDTVTSKLILAEKCREYNIPLISSMGTGNKIDPSKFQISDINKTSVCPLARVMRRELKKRNIDSLKVLFSTETPHREFNGERFPASNSFVPAAAGLMIAGEVINDIIFDRVKK